MFSSGRQRIKRSPTGMEKRELFVKTDLTVGGDGRFGEGGGKCRRDVWMHELLSEELILFTMTFCESMSAGDRRMAMMFSN